MCIPNNEKPYEMTFEHRRAVWETYVCSNKIKTIPDSIVRELFNDPDTAVCVLEAYLMQRYA